MCLLLTEKGFFMITTITGDMLETATTGFMVHGCNAQGAMGSGIAWAIREKWPVVYEVYNRRQIDCGLSMGEIVPVSVNDELVVVNAITQEYYIGHKDAKGIERFVDYEAIAKCFEQINDLPNKYPDIEPILHFPLIGADRGRGNWNIIEAIIDESITSMEKVLWRLG